MILAPNHPQTGIEKKLSGPVGVDEADQLVTPSPGVSRLFLLG